MKLWIAALAISALSACGHENSTEDQSATAANRTTTQPALPESQQQAAGPFGGDTSGIIIDTSVSRPGAAPRTPPGAPPGDPNAPKPGHEKPKARPKPVVIDIMK